MLKESIGHHLLSVSPLRTKGRDGQAEQKEMLMESIGYPLLSISPLGTRGRDGKVGLKAVLKESIGHTLLSMSPLRTKVMGWTSSTGTIKGVDRTSFTIH